MARIRSIKPEFFTSEVVSRLPLSARLTFIGLWTYVDDNGVGMDNVRLILAALYPLDEDPTEALRRVSEDLRSLSGAGLVQRYEVDGRQYLFICGWDEHQKVSHPRKPRFARPLTCENVNPPESLPKSSGATPETLRPEQGAGSREQGAGSTSGGDGKPSAKPRKRATPPPDDFEITDAMRAWGREHAPLVTDPAAETRQFLDHARANGKAFKDWPAAWRTWMGNAQRFASQRGNIRPLPSRTMPPGTHPHRAHMWEQG